MATPEAVWSTVRHGVGRVLGPLAAPRTGWFYVVRRGIASRVSDGIRNRPTRAANEALPLAALDDAAPRVRTHPVVAARSLPGVPLPEPAASDPRTAPARAPWAARAQEVLEIPDGVSLGPSGRIGIDDRRLLITGPMTRCDPDHHTNAVRRECARHAGGRVVRRPGRTAVLLQHLVGNYYHCLAQGFTGLDAIDRAIGLDAVDRFLVPHRISPYARELLARLGIGPDRLEPVPTDGPIRYECQTLVTTTFPDDQRPGPLDVVEPLRRHFAAEIDSGAARPRHRWYLTRGAPWSRRVENEDEVRAALAARGFEVLVLDERTVAEQASLVAGAECIVGVHGSALTNLAFATPGTRVVELMPTNVRRWIFARLSQSAGLAYDVVMGAEPSPPSALTRFLMDADLRIDVDRLCRRVDAALG